MKTYSEKLKDPRWQRKRLEIMQRDNFTCTQCGDKHSTLNVHHWEYAKEPWDAKKIDLSTVCVTCHKNIEDCKAVLKELLRKMNFRLLLEYINKTNTFGEVQYKFFSRSVTVTEKQKHHSDYHDEGYKVLTWDDDYEIGDEYFDDGVWVVLTSVSDDNHVCMGDTVYRRKIINEVKKTEDDLKWERLYAEILKDQPKNKPNVKNAFSSLDSLIDAFE